MADKVTACRGGLLGLAAGDAMGRAVDGKTREEICADYCPYGLLGYDLVNETASGSAYTQVAAYVSNGLLLGVTRFARVGVMVISTGLSLLTLPLMFVLVWGICKIGGDAWKE